MGIGFLRKLRDACKKIAPIAVQTVARVAPIVGGPAGAVAGAALNKLGNLLK